MKEGWKMLEEDLKSEYINPIRLLPVHVMNGGLTLFNPTGSKINQKNNENQNSTSINRHFNEDFGIRFDWDVNLEESTKVFSDQHTQIVFFSQNEELEEIQRKSSNYIGDFLQLMHKNYPNDSFRLFSGSIFKSSIKKDKKKKEQSKTDYDNVKSETKNPYPYLKISNAKKKLFHQFNPEKFGLTFISHAHADHCPAGISLPNLFVQSNETQKKENLYPFPLFCSELTQDLIRIRFNRNIINYNIDFEIFDKDYVRYYQNILDNYRKFYSENICDENLPGWPLYNYFVIHKWKDLYIWLIPAGHVVGSSALCVISDQSLKQIYEMRKVPESSERDNDRENNNNNMSYALYAPYADFIYLGEICPIHRRHCYSLPNINCQSLMVDTLFVDPSLNFPDQKLEFERLIKWIFDEISEHPVVIFCGELGKPQLIAAEVYEYLKQKSNYTDEDEFCIIMSKSYTRVFFYLISKGWKFPKILSKSEARKAKYPQSKNYLLIVPSLERDSASLKKFIEKRGAVTADVTGWCYQEKYRKEHVADEYFTITDHITYSELDDFLKNSNVKQIISILDSEKFIKLD